MEVYATLGLGSEEGGRVEGEGVQQSGELEKNRRDGGFTEKRTTNNLERFGGRGEELSLWRNGSHG